MSMRLEQRLSAKYSVAKNGCWQWAGKPDKFGYGRLRVGDRMRFAHRVSYEVHVGPIGEGLHIDHLCRNRMCINPAHMEPVTSRTNTQRGWRATKMYCDSGHPLFGANLYLRRDGKRQCRQCVSVRKQA